MSEYIQSEEFQQIVDKEIADHFDKLSTLRIDALFCDKIKKSGNMFVYADCERVNDKYNALTGIDFVITFYRPSSTLSNEGKRRVAEHELMHVGWDGANKTIIKHSVEDFKEMIVRYGLDWIQGN